MGHKQAGRRGVEPSAGSVTFGKYGFTLTERKLSPHEQKLWPLAIRRGGGGGSLFGQMADLSSTSLLWLARLLLRLGPFVILLYCPDNSELQTSSGKAIAYPLALVGKESQLS